MLKYTVSKMTKGMKDSVRTDPLDFCGGWNISQNIYIYIYTHPLIY